MKGLRPRRMLIVFVVMSWISISVSHLQDRTYKSTGCALCAFPHDNKQIPHTFHYHGASQDVFKLQIIVLKSFPHNFTSGTGCTRLGPHSYIYTNINPYTCISTLVSLRLSTLTRQSSSVFESFPDIDPGFLLLEHFVIHLLNSGQAQPSSTRIQPEKHTIYYKVMLME